jgi:hypothetical protein
MLGAQLIDKISHKFAYQSLDPSHLVHGGQVSSSPGGSLILVAPRDSLPWNLISADLYSTQRPAWCRFDP